MRALAIMEKKIGKPITQLDFSSIYIDELVVVIWAGLIHEDKEITVDALFDIIDNNNITYDALVTMMLEGLNASYETDDEVKDENPNQAAAGN